MKVTAVNGWVERSGRSCEVYEVKIDGLVAAEFSDGEREDANIMRDFSGVKDIPDLMKQAYEAGKRGESFEIAFEEYVDPFGDDDDEEPLYNAHKDCNHNIVSTPGGGVKCTKCPGWFCY